MKIYRKEYMPNSTRTSKRRKLIDPITCPDCNQVYVKTQESRDEKVGISYLKDFPSYGLDKEQCEECEEQIDK